MTPAYRLAPPRNGERFDTDIDERFDIDIDDGHLDSLDLTLTDDTAGETEDTVAVSVSGGTASGTTRLVAAGDDGAGNSYTVDATVTDSNGNTGSGSTTASERAPTPRRRPASTR